MAEIVRTCRCEFVYSERGPSLQTIEIKGVEINYVSHRHLNSTDKIIVLSEKMEVHNLLIFHLYIRLCKLNSAVKNRSGNMVL